MSLFLNTALFLSTHVNRIDGKGRVSFPAPFRSALAARNSQGIVLFKSLNDPAVEGMTVERLLHMNSAMEKLPPFSKERRAFQINIFGAAQELQVDREGRCSLPRPLLEKIGIPVEAGAEVAFLGCGSTFQIWNPEVLAKVTAESEEALKAGDVEFPALPEGVL